MRRGSLRFLTAVFLVLGTCLSGNHSAASAIVCVHADGRTAVESGTQPCCREAAPERVPGQPARLQAEAGGCPGCTDIALDDAGQSSSRHRPAPPSSRATGSIGVDPIAPRTLHLDLSSAGARSPVPRLSLLGLRV